MIISQENKKGIFLCISVLSTAFIWCIIPFARDLSVIFNLLQEKGLFFPFLAVSFIAVWSISFILMKDYLKIVFPGMLISFASIAVLLYFMINIPILLEKIHLLMYGALSVFLYFYLLFLYDKVYSALLSAAVTFNIGLIDELIQYFVPNRVGDYRDIFFNSVSAVIGLAVFYPLTAYMKKRTGYKSVIAVYILFILFFSGSFFFISFIHGFGYKHHDGNIVFFSTFRKGDLIEYDAVNRGLYDKEVRGLTGVKMSDYLEAFSRRKDPYIYELIIRIYRYISFKNKIEDDTIGKKEILRLENSLKGEEYILRTYFRNGIKPLENEVFNLKLKQNPRGNGKYKSMILDDIFYYCSRPVLGAFLLIIQAIVGIILYYWFVIKGQKILKA